MMQLVLRKPKTKLPEADYVLDNSEDILVLVKVLTPKFDGNWNILLIDPKITLVKKIVDENIIPDYINCSAYINNAKMEKLIMDYPKLTPKQKSVKESYKELVGNLKHLMDTKAMYELYNAIGPNLGELQEALTKLDTECQGDMITVKQVRAAFNCVRRVYASEVMLAFFSRDKYRWYKLEKLVKDLGDAYAYNSLYKFTSNLLKEKNKYLHNEDTKLRAVENVDGMLCCYAYALFANSHSYHNLYGIMLALDNRSSKYLELIQSVN